MNSEKILYNTAFSAQLTCLSGHSHFRIKFCVSLKHIPGIKRFCLNFALASLDNG